MREFGKVYKFEQAPPIVEKKQRKRMLFLESFRKKELPTLTPEEREETTEPVSYRVQGALERANPEIAPLAPTPITPDAQERLSLWGMTPNQITHLQELTSSMRYDLAKEKAERIATLGGYIADFSETKIVIPDLFDTTGRLDGQCSEIAINLLKVMRSSKLLTETNAHAPRQIIPYHIRGQSRDYFNKENTTHFWLGLLPEGEDEGKMVTVDGSFQEISLAENNGYIPRTSRKNPSAFYGEKTAWSLPTEPYYGGLIMGTGHRGIILGPSVDKKFIYRMGFAEHIESKAIYPFISCIDQDGEVSGTCVGETTNHWLGEALNTAVEEEMSSIIDALKPMQLRKDNQKAYDAVINLVTIPIE